MTGTALLTGYSGKPLLDKLGLKPGMSVAFVALPPALDGLAAAAPFAAVERAETWMALRAAPARFDAIHAFATCRAEVESGLPRLQSALRRDGMIWVSWPKKAARAATDLTEDGIRATALSLDLVDVKVVAIDAIWSGLKLVIRKDRR
jgi:hypothetical protein